MKKIGIFLIFIILLLLYQTNGFVLATKAFSGKYSTVFENEKISNEYNLSAKEVLLQKIYKGNNTGESVKFLGEQKDIESFIQTLDIKIVDKQNLANITILYGYSSKLKHSITIENRKINVQIAKRGRTITIGTPLIKGSY